MVRHCQWMEDKQFVNKRTAPEKQGRFRKNVLLSSSFIRFYRRLCSRKITPDRPTNR